MQGKPDKCVGKNGVDGPAPNHKATTESRALRISRSGSDRIGVRGGLNGLGASVEGVFQAIQRQKTKQFFR